MSKLSDSSYVFTIDSGVLSEMGKYLCDSLISNVENPDIYVFIPESSLSHLSGEYLSYFDSNCTILTGEIPLPDYPVSALIQGLISAQEKSSNEYTVALDTDILVFDAPTITETNGGKNFAVPAGIGANYWASIKSTADWHELYEWYQIDAPQFMLTSQCDRRTIHPYWNSGVVVTKQKAFAEKWLETTRKLIQNPPNSRCQNSFFKDQIALTLVGLEHGLESLTSEHNYQFGCHLHVPNDVKILHYGDYKHLRRIANPVVRKKIPPNLRKYPTINDVPKVILALISGLSGFVVSDEIREKVGWIYP